MEEQMMQNMPMGKDSMSHCPMMKGMKDMDHTSAGPHKEHQEAQK